MKKKQLKPGTRITYRSKLFGANKAEDDLCRSHNGKTGVVIGRRSHKDYPPYHYDILFMDGVQFYADRSELTVQPKRTKPKICEHCIDRKKPRKPILHKHGRGHLKVKTKKHPLGNSHMATLPNGDMVRVYN